MRRGRFLVLMVILGIASFLWAVNLDAQPDDISLDDNEVFTSRSRPAVEFPTCNTSTLKSSAVIVTIGLRVERTLWMRVNWKKMQKA